MSEKPPFRIGRYPVLYTLCTADDRQSAAIDLAVLVKGVPSFLTRVEVPADHLDALVTSLQRGDVRIEIDVLEGDTLRRAPGAVVTLVCADGRAVSLGTVHDPTGQARTPADVAREVTSRLARGVQISSLLRSAPSE